MTSFADFDRMTAELELHGWRAKANPSRTRYLVFRGAEVVYHNASGSKRLVAAVPPDADPVRWIDIKPQVLQALHEKAILEMTTP